jgi:hypothetical protein
MRYAQLNPRGIVINLPESAVCGSAEHRASVHAHDHETIWAHLQGVAAGQSAPLIALAEDAPLPSIGQRWNGESFVDDAEWLSERSEQFRIEAEEQDGLGNKEHAAEARKKSADYAARAKKAGK